MGTESLSESSSKEGFLDTINKLLTELNDVVTACASCRVLLVSLAWPPTVLSYRRFLGSIVSRERQLRMVLTLDAFQNDFLELGR